MVKITYSNETLYRIAHVAESHIREQLDNYIEMAKKSKADITLIAMYFANGDVQRIVVEKDKTEK